MNNMRKASAIMSMVITLIIVLSFVGSGLSTLIKGVKSYKNYQTADDADYAKVTAKIVDIDVEKVGDNYEHDVYIEYTYEGQEYTNVQLNYYSSSMYIGQQIDIYCNKEYPTKLKSRISFNPAIISIAFGAMFIIAALIFLIIIINVLMKKSNGTKYLLKKGRLLRGSVESIAPEQNTYGNTGFYKVFCTYTDPSNNNIYRFVSDSISEQDAAYVTEGMPVDIYVNRKNYREHYVDLNMSNRQNVVDYTRY